MELFIISGSSLDAFSFDDQAPFGLAQGNEEFQHLAIHGDALERRACQALIDLWPIK